MKTLAVAFALTLLSSAAWAGTTCTRIGNQIFCNTYNPPVYQPPVYNPYQPVYTPPRTTTCTVIGNQMFCN